MNVYSLICGQKLSFWTILSLLMFNSVVSLLLTLSGWTTFWWGQGSESTDSYYVRVHPLLCVRQYLFYEIGCPAIGTLPWMCPILYEVGATGVFSAFSVPAFIHITASLLPPFSLSPLQCLLPQLPSVVYGSFVLAAYTSYLNRSNLWMNLSHSVIPGVPTHSASDCGEPFGAWIQGFWVLFFSNQEIWLPALFQTSPQSLNQRTGLDFRAPFFLGLLAEWHRALLSQALFSWEPALCLGVPPYFLLTDSVGGFSSLPVVLLSALR